MGRSARMHSVSGSANTRADRRQQTADRISVHAQVLTDERGLDGWTMDDLAEASGVSRRTLFNYFPHKVDAVLGPQPELDDTAVATFRARDAGSDLVTDLRRLGSDLLEMRGLGREDLARSRRILVANPRLLAAAHARLLTVSSAIVELIRDREGAGFDAQRAQIAVSVLAALFDAALDRFIGEPRARTLAEAYDDVLRTARQLLA